VVFAHCGRVITLSNHTAKLVREAMGEEFPVFAIPAASYEFFAEARKGFAPSEEHLLRLRGYLFDSATDPRFTANPPWPPVPAPHFVPQPGGDAEPAIEAVPTAVIAAPAEPVRPGMRRRVSLTFYYARAWYRDVLRDLMPGPVKRLASFCGRRLYRAYHGAPPVPPAPPPLPEHDLTLRGTVYVSVLAPQDGRKNWQDMLMGFLWTFRENPDATLFLKMPVRGGVEAYHALYAIMNRFAPFKCRVLCFAGFLDDDGYRDLVRAVTWYLNTSHAEGLCLPLMEFLSAGVPAIAPDHTAMADYIDPSLAFVLRASLEHNVWPFDPRDMFTTMRYRLNWQSLVEALEQSFVLDAGGYAAMSEAAQSGMRGFCALDVVQTRLAQALGVADAVVPQARKVAA
jgi:hypothetical protein